MAKWNRIIVDDDPDRAELLDGRVTQGLRVGMCDEDVERLRQGYMCIQCFEPLDSAFPKACPLCTYPIAEQQAELFGAIYAGHIPGLRTGPDWEAEADRLEERKERRAFARRAKESGIVVPRML